MLDIEGHCRLYLVLVLEMIRSSEKRILLPECQIAYPVWFRSIASHGTHQLTEPGVKATRMFAYQEDTVSCLLHHLSYAY